LGVATPYLVACYLRSFFVVLKFGTKAYSVLAAGVFSLAVVVGCNSEETPPAGGAAPVAAPGAVPPGRPPAAETKSAPTTTEAPPVTQPKDKEEMKPKDKDEAKPKP
jgi:hypothetical protein